MTRDIVRRPIQRIQPLVSAMKFRRQQPLGSYIVDFVCLSERLIVELDSEQHARDVAYDKRRSRWLIAQGFTVLRFWNNDLFDNIDGVMYRISDELTRSLENNRRLSSNKMNRLPKLLRPLPTSPSRGEEPEPTPMKMSKV